MARCDRIRACSALLPNDLTPEPHNPPGGANSDYTAADFQHMLLAAQVPNARRAGGNPDAPLDAPAGTVPLLGEQADFASARPRL